jgi:hypothetical protein
LSAGVSIGATGAVPVAAGCRAGGWLSGSGEGASGWGLRRHTIADPGLVATGAAGVIAPSVIIRFPVSPTLGRGPRGVAETLNGAPGATVLVVTDSVGRPIRSGPANSAEANGDACRKVNGAPLPG